MSAGMHGALRKAYVLGVVCCAVALAGMVVAPFTGIVYVIALPGVLLTAWVATIQESRSRWALIASAGLLLVGAALFACAIFLSWTDTSGLARELLVLLRDNVLVLMFGIPLVALLLGVPSVVVAHANSGKGCNGSDV